MEDWFKEFGRPALSNALAGVCDQLDADFDAGIKFYVQKNAQLTAELETLKCKVSEVDRLDEENRSLKKQIQNLKNASRRDASNKDKPQLQDDSRGSRTPLAPRSLNQVSNTERPNKSTKPNHPDVERLRLPEIKEKYLRVEGNYTKLQGRYSELQDANTELNQRLRDKTRAYKQWMDHANKLNEQCRNRSRKIKKLEAKLAAAVSSPANLSFSSDIPDVRPIHPSKHCDSDTSDELGLARPTPIPRESPLKWPPAITPNTDDDPSINTNSKAPVQMDDRSRADRRREYTPDLELHSNIKDMEAPLLPPVPQCRDEVAEMEFIKDEPSSDAPVVVSERCLRKRKHDDQTEQMPAPTRIKTEDHSDPLSADERRHFTAHESIDFDAECSRVDTPRKRNRLDPQPEDMSMVYFTRASQSGASGSRSTRREDHEILGTMGQEHSPTRSLPDGDAVPAAPVRQRTASASPDLQPQQSSALRPLSRNIMLQPRTGAEPIAKPSSAQDALASLAEDGGEHHALKASKGNKPKASRTLHDLLDSACSEREVVSLPARVQQENMPSTRHFQWQVPQRRELPFGKDGPKKARKLYQPPETPAVSNNKRISTVINAKRLSDGAAARNGAARDTTPLRERPKSRLRLDDFKINPGANEGYGYAYTDVVRGKEQRACLSGCVKENCCGESFRALARSMRGATGPVDFQVLLENYLGDAAWELSTMSPPEKEKLWLEAKTRELSDTHGRHRHRYQRMASPPGFWRTDFPSTQEGEQDREEAAKMERQIIEERYREAMRPGGRWLFRD
ncbi:SAE2-domain-containing protein, partial [Xylariaceae sp. FL0662B]